MDKYSTVTIRETQELKKIKITSDLKPEIINSVISKWQLLLDTTAHIVNVPSGLIMRLNEETIEVFLKSRTAGNPYEAGEEAKLIYGLYCETVIGTQKELLVPDATKNIVWKKDNPDVDINMISYLGYPINWPDGESFGTVCLLDNKENSYSKDFRNLLFTIKQHIEADLQLVMANQDLSLKNLQLKELAHTQTRFLSLISHDVRGSVSTVNEFLRLIIGDFNNYEAPDLHTILKALSQNVSSAFLTLENLLNWTKSDLVRLETDITQVNIVDVIEELLQYFKQASIIKNIKIEKEFYANTAFIAADVNMITVSLRNILSNAIKYTKKGGSIRIRILHPDKQHIIEIEDTGIGMDASAINSLFKYNKSHSKKGTQGESSAGIGLLLAKEFLDKNNATIKIESVVDKGTKFIITI